MIKVTIFHYFIGLINGDLTEYIFVIHPIKKFIYFSIVVLEHEKLISTKPTEVSIVGWGLLFP
jgi:hypothetical protein